MHKILDKHKVIVLAADRYPVNSFTDTPALLTRLRWLGIDGGSLMPNIFEAESFMRMKCLKLLRVNVNKI